MRLISLSHDSVDDLRALNAALFPVGYSNKFYKDALAGPPEHVRLVYEDEILIGAVCCSIDNEDDLYVMTLGVRASYRERGVGTQLVQHVLNTAVSSPLCTRTRRIYMHVQEGNEEALLFYRKFGFHVKRKLMFYYARVDPPHCYELEKIIRPHRIDSSASEHSRADSVPSHTPLDPKSAPITSTIISSPANTESITDTVCE